MSRPLHAKMQALLDSDTASEQEREFARGWLEKHPLKPLTREEILSVDDTGYGEREHDRQLQPNDVDRVF